MADEEQVARLKRSIDEWNQWRKRNSVRSYYLDLRFAHLIGANLSGAVRREVT
jgi:hypothetical protein